MTGRFITLEGGEGAGKSTQLALLAETVRASGHAVVTTREPGGSAGAEAIRELLMTGDTERWSAAAEALLFAAARADHVQRLIRPALERGEWVICDRFIDSTRAYQGGAGGLSDADILSLHRIGSGGLLPDRTLVLAIDAEEAHRRVALREGAPGDRFGRKDAAYHARVAAHFAEMAAAEPARFRMIDASGTPAEITARGLAAIEDLL